VSPPELRTTRLRLVPLDAEAMRLLIEDWPALQRRLDARPSPAWITDGPTLIAARQHRERMLREPEAWLWWTFWQVLQVRDGECVGLVDFKGPPGADGGVTLGCAFARAYWNRGYATEAVATLLAWALGHAGVRSVTADTDGEHHRAHRVLRKLGFTPMPGDSRGRSRESAADLETWRLAKAGEPSDAG
jgi:RimJ/RimL family protein N-acetyltransferase